MKRFQFPLDAVKKLRAHGERQAQAELGERLTAQAAAQRAVEARRQTLAAADARMRIGTLSVASLIHADRERSAARLHVENATAQVEAEVRLVDDARVKLAEARKRLEALQRLEDSRRAQHREAALREEEDLLQDVVQARAARQAQLRSRT
jgi:flagellar biosynthesis chaperone FliJ